MDRVTVADGQIPLASDILRTNQFAMVANAKTNEAVLGAATTVYGFGLSATAPATLVLNLGAGTIFQQESLEATPWSSLPADTAHLIQKQGISLDPTPLTFTPPGASGYSQAFLVQVRYLETDTALVLRPYYNAADPDVQFNGPGGSGTKDSTVRQGGVDAEIKPGVAVNSGSPAAPTPDPGFVGLYVVTLASGATQITAANFSAYSGAPNFTPLPLVPANVQAGSYVYARDIGTQNAVAFTLTPTPIAYGEGRAVRTKAAYDCTGASTANMNGLGNRAIHTSGGNPTIGGEWKAGDVIELTDDGSSWQLRGVFGATATTTQSATQTTVGDTNYTILTGDKRLVTTTSMSAPRTWTLPSASSFGIGDIIFTDRVGAVSAVNPLTFVPNGLDQIDGLTSVTLGSPYRSIALRSDGNSRWTYDRSAAPNMHLAGDANVTVSAYDSTIATSVALTAARTWTLPAASLMRAGGSITLTDLFGACSSSFPVTIARSVSDTINGQTSLTLTATYFQVIAVSDGVSRWAIQFVDVSQILGLLKGTADGGCYLSVSSPTVLTLGPKNGNTLVIANAPQTVPSPGPTLTLSGPNPNTLYYIYAYMNGGTMSLEGSTIGYATDSFGRNYKTGDTTRRLIGIAYTNSASQFADTPTWRGLSNFFNRQALTIDSGYIGSMTIPADGTTKTPIDAPVPFYNWAGDKVEFYALAVCGQTGAFIVAYVNVDGTASGFTMTGFYPYPVPSGGYPAQSTQMYATQILAEGLHTTQGVMTATPQSGGSTTAPLATARHFGFIRG